MKNMSLSKRIPKEEDYNSTTYSPLQIHSTSDISNQNSNIDQCVINSIINRDIKHYDSQDVNPKKRNNCLSILTTKFLQIVKSKNDYTIDINEAAKTLGVQKRRVYDITNVLQGIGYVQKIQKNQIKWIGPTQDDNTIQQQIGLLVQQLKQLQEQQRQLDQYLLQMSSRIQQQYTNNRQIQEYKYITYHDCQQLTERGHFGQKLLIVVQAPQGSNIQTFQQINNNKLTISSKGNVDVFSCKKGEKMQKVSVLQQN